MTAQETTGETQQHSVLNSSFPVLLPHDAALFMSESEFQALLQKTLRRQTDLKALKEEIVAIDGSDAATIVETEPENVSNSKLKRRASIEANSPRLQKAPFLAGLEKHAAYHRTQEELEKANKNLTENADVTNISSKSAIVDLFYDLGENTGSAQLKILLDDAWKEDSLLTLKIIFNARSIHLGKSNRVAAYKALGWLAENHPLTLLANLRWLVRPVIGKLAEKKQDKKKEEGEQNDEDFDMMDVEEGDPTKAFDVRYGVSHGYWKDLLNLVVFAANDQLRFDGDPASLLTIKPDNSAEGKRKRTWDQQTAKEARHLKRKQQHERVQQKLKDDSFYRALHVSVARLFAEQLREDKALLDSGTKADLKKLSLASKWAPTFGEFHDKHTFILSSIAEILFPDPAAHCPDANNRDLYLRHVRELYRKQYASPLRKALSIVERDIAAEKFENIKYDRVPSLAMERYTGLFVKKDFERFKGYIQDVAKGTAKISGATLLPSTLISKARGLIESTTVPHTKGFKALQAAAEAGVSANVIDGQWNSLVKRIRDAGTLNSSIAVCDVSGSMTYDMFKDKSCPIDSAIGLSLLIAEVTAPPFGGGFISFSEQPTYLSLRDCSDVGLVQKVHYILGAPWGMNTNFVAVFEDVILPMAIANKLKQEDMVKQIFVFSDMQFDGAQSSSDRWTTSYERIKTKYAEAGYEMPRLVFWNLAAKSTDKPATMDDVDTALVSGYSQGMLRAFLESGAFDHEEEIVDDDVVDMEEENEGEGMAEIRKVKKKIDPLTVVKKAVEHKAYGMLEVVD